MAKIPGGFYIVDGQVVNANNQPIPGWTVVDGQAMRIEDLQAAAQQAKEEVTPPAAPTKGSKGKTQKGQNQSQSDPNQPDPNQPATGGSEGE